VDGEDAEGETAVNLFEPQPNVFYDLSGGMESAAMIVLDIDRIRFTEAIVRIADTGKQFPEMMASLAQIESILGIQVFRIAPRITFDEFLFDRGGMLRKGTVDCSIRMKRRNLSAHARRFRPPYEINLGFNAGEVERMDSFVALNERDWCHWRFPLIERGIEREQTWDICRKAGFTILVGMYEKMGRFDCFWCPNQSPAQALKVIEHYPELAAEWSSAEERKGHSFLPIPLKLIAEKRDEELRASTGCACFGGDVDVWEEST
jgi:hypothetical protein